MAAAGTPASPRGVLRLTSSSSLSRLRCGAGERLTGPLGAERTAIEGLDTNGLRRPPMPCGACTTSTVASEPGQIVPTTASAFASTYGESRGVAQYEVRRGRCGCGVFVVRRVERSALPRAHSRRTCWSFVASLAKSRAVIIGRPEVWHLEPRRVKYITGERVKLSAGFALNVTVNEI